MGDIMKEKKNIPEIRFEGFVGEWEIRKLEEISDSYSGGTPSVGISEFYNGFIPFIRSAEINKNSTELYITELGLLNSSAKLVDVGNILYALYGATSGEVGRSQVKGAINQAILAIIPKNGFDAEFIMQYLRKKKKEIISTYLQGGQGNLSGAIVKKLNIDLPKYVEQSQIGTFFQNLDKQITLEQQKHDKLVTLKKAMLEKMYPKEGASVPEIRFEGFEGEWEEKKLVDIGYTYTGLSGKNKTDFGHGKGRYVTYMNVFSNTIAKKENTEAIEVDHSQNNVQFGDVFFTTSSETPEEVGMSSVWLADCQDTYLNSFCFGYRPVIKVDNYYFAYLLRSTVIRKKIIFLAQGISRYNISKNKVMEISVPLPTIEEQSQIGSYFQNLDKLISLQQQKINKLKNIKKACLDKMFV